MCDVCWMQEVAIATERVRYDQLQNRYDAYIRERMEERSRLQGDHAKLAQDLENQYEMKLALEMERYDRLAEHMERLKQGCESLLREAKVRHDADVSRLSQEVRNRQDELDRIRSKLEVWCRYSVDVGELWG